MVWFLVFALFAVIYKPLFCSKFLKILLLLQNTVLVHPFCIAVIGYFGKINTKVKDG